MKKLLTFFMLGAVLVVAGCGEEVSQEKTTLEAKQEIIETVSQETLERLAEVQATQNKENCKEFKEENIRAQCEETIKLNK